MTKNNSTTKTYIRNGLIGLGIGIVGLVYLSNMPEPVQKNILKEVNTKNYTLVDANNDKKVDLILINEMPKYINRNIQRTLENSGDKYRFLGFSRMKPISPEIQSSADLVFSGDSSESSLERVLKFK